MTEPAPSAPAPEKGEDTSGDATFMQHFLQGLWRANTPTVTILAIVLAMIFGGILIVVSNPDIVAMYGYFFADPGAAISASLNAVGGAYADLFKGAVFDPATVSGWINGTNGWEAVFYPISETLTYAVPLVFTGLSVALAFRGGLFNIGAQGQAAMGVILAGLIGFLVHLPVGLHVLVAVLGAAVGGAIWGFVPGFLKARTGAHEVITTIMLNYVALLFLNWVIDQKVVHSVTRTDAISKPMDASAKFPHLLGGTLRLDAGIFVALLVAWGVSWLLNRSTFGFELRAVGANPAAARTAGMSVAKVTIIVMVIAGALAGLGGGTQVIGSQADALTGTVLTQIGFNGILVALLGRVRPWGVVLGALLYGALQAGGNRMQSYDQISLQLVYVLQALIVLFVAAPALVKAIFRLRAARAAKLDTTLAKGW